MFLFLTRGLLIFDIFASSVGAQSLPPPAENPVSETQAASSSGPKKLVRRATLERWKLEIEKDSHSAKAFSRTPEFDGPRTAQKDWTADQVLVSDNVITDRAVWIFFGSCAVHRRTPMRFAH